MPNFFGNLKYVTDWPVIDLFKLPNMLCVRLVPQFGTPFRNDQPVGHFEMGSQTEAPNEHATVMGWKVYTNIKMIVHTPAGREPGIGNCQNGVCQIALGMRLATLFLNQLDRWRAQGAQKMVPKGSKMV